MQISTTQERVSAAEIPGKLKIGRPDRRKRYPLQDLCQFSLDSLRCQVRDDKIKLGLLVSMHLIDRVRRYRWTAHPSLVSLI